MAPGGLRANAETPAMKSALHLRPAPGAAAPESAGDPAAAWIAQGDLARARGFAEDAAERYRTAALALHDARA